MTASWTWEVPWQGDKLKKVTRERAANALNSTAAAAVQVAQQLAPRLTGFMANGIVIVERATPGQLEVTWGNVTANYTLWQEIGSNGRPGRYFLRGGAERAYPMYEQFLHG